MKSWLFHTYRPNAAFLLAAGVIYFLFLAEAPLIVWIILAILIYFWFGLALYSFRLTPQAMIVDRAIPIFTLFLTQRRIAYHDILRVKIRRIGWFWWKMEIITSVGTFHVWAGSLRPNRRFLRDLKRYCPEKLKQERG